MDVVDDRERSRPPGLEDERLRSVWDDLEEPPFAGVPPGFSARVMGRARDEAAAPARLSWAGAPGWAKAVAIVALSAGAAMGAGLAALAHHPNDADAADALAFEEESSLAERYLSSLEEAGQ
jgi:hypothetical protein